MEKEKEYKRIVLRPETIEKLLVGFTSEVEDAAKLVWGLSVTTGHNETWALDSFDEWLADYRRVYPPRIASLSLYDHSGPVVQPRYLSVRVAFFGTNVTIRDTNRASIERLFAIVDREAEEGRLRDPPKAPSKPRPPTRVFIGHGGSQQWRDLKDHLSDLHGIDVDAYETGSRAGHTIRDILVDLLKQSSFAVLVMTGEDETATGLRARQNVIHEIGLFQGRLGFAKAIALVEKGVEEFSNLQGVHVIYFDVGRIKETFGEVVAAIRAAEKKST